MCLKQLKKEIENQVMSCSPSQIVKKSQQKKLATSIDIPNRPWQKLGLDTFFQGGKWYLLIAHYYSKFPIVHSLLSTI